MKTDYGYLVKDEEDVYVFKDKSIRITVEPGTDVELTSDLAQFIAEKVNERKG